MCVQVRQQKLDGVVARWHLLQLQPCWRWWVEYSRKLSSAKRVVKKLSNRNLHMALDGWADATRHWKHVRETMTRLAKNWGAGPLAAAWRRWDEWVMDILWQRQEEGKERKRQWLLKQLFKGCPEDDEQELVGAS